MSDYQLHVQRVEFLAAAPGESQSAEPTVILTIRPEPSKNFRPHNIALSRTQAIRLLKSLRIVLRQSVGVFLLGLGLATASGCSAEVHVTTEETAPMIAAAAQATTKKRAQTAVAVDILGGGKPKPAEEWPSVKEPAAAAPPPEPKKAVEIVGDGNAVLVVEGNLHLHSHIHVYEAPQLEHVEIEIRSNDVERSERCERLRREYEEKVRQLRRMFNQ